MDSRKTGPSARAAAASATTSGPKHGRIAQASTSDMSSSSSAPALALRKKPKKRLSSGTAAPRDESEFVSVEVGMREFQRRLASSKSKASGSGSSRGNTDNSRPVSVSGASSSSSKRQPHGDIDGATSQAERPAPEQPKKRARTSTAAAATPLPVLAPDATTAVRKSATAPAAPRARKPAAAVRSSTDSSVLQDHVKTPRKRAAHSTTGSAKAMALATATPATRKPRAAPVARRQTTIAEIRAQLLREQQERVELRIQTLHCANCNSVTHAHTDGHVHTHVTSVDPPAAAAVVEPHRSIYQQQQQLQPVTTLPPAQQTHSIHHQPQQQSHTLVAPPVLPAQHSAPALEVHPNPTTYTEAPLAQPINAPAVIAQPTGTATTQSEPDPIKNEFISDDFNEDMAFMLALDEVERNFTTSTTPTKPPALVMAPALPPPSSSTSTDLHQHFAPMPTRQQLGAGGCDGLKQQPTGESQRGSSQLIQVKTEPSHQAPVSAMSADVQREFERLKRENELLRQSNELLQAAATSSSGAATAVHQAPLVVAPSPIHQTYHQLQPATAMREEMLLSPSPSPSPSSVASNAAPAVSSGSSRALQSSSPPPPIVEDSQHQPVARRSLDLHRNAGIIKEEPVPTDTTERSTEAAGGSNDGNTMQQNQNGGEPAMQLQATQKNDHPHHRSPRFSPTIEFEDSRASRDSPSGHQFDKVTEVESTQSQPLAEDQDGISQVGEAQAVALERHDRRLDEEDYEDQSGDVVNTQQSSENETSGVSQSENVDERNDEDEEEESEGAFEEASQEEISRASTIDRGNYQQYKAHNEEADEDDDEAAGHGDGTGADADDHDVVASMDVDEDGTQSEHVSSPRHSPSSTSSPSRVSNEVNASEKQAGADIATRSTTSPSKTLGEADGESKLRLVESPAVAPIAVDPGVIHQHDERVARGTSGRDKAQGPVAEKNDDTVDMEDDDDVTPWEEIKFDMTAEAADLEVDEYEEEVEVGAPQPPTAKARLRVQEISSSSSESDSETESEEEENDEAGGGSTANMLEAALKAAASGSSGSSTTAARTSSTSQRSQQQQRGALSLDATVSVKDQPKLGRDVSKPVPKKRPRSSDDRTDDGAITVPEKKVARAKRQLGSTTASSSSLGGSSSGSNGNSTVKSTLLWPALDEFYEFILELSPRRIEVPDKHQSNLRRYSRSTLPTKYTSLNEYTSVQIEAIMEELAASLRSSEQFSNQNNSKSLFLTSVSPCGQQHSLPSGQQQLNSNSIFMESGFSGTTSGKNDFILTFRPQHSGRGGGGSSSSSDFISGDLIMLRSPRWKQYEMIVYGVVLCNSVVAIGGSSSGSGGGGSRGGGDTDNDLICVLIRTREHDHANPKEDFSVLTEMCLANQRSPNWKWRLEQVHNLTTSAREFQAIKSIVFLSASIKRSLIEGKMSASDEQKGKKTGGAGEVKASASTINGSKEAKSRVTPALHTELAKKYNASQLEAILGCIGEENHVIIQGPPGTGKTKTILGVLSALLDGAALGGPKKSKESTRIRIGASLNNGNASSGPRTVAETTIRILVAAPSNAAVDELIVRLLSEGVYDGVKGCTYRPRIVRVGRPESLQRQSSSDDSKGKGQLQTDNTKIKKKKWRKYAQEVEEILLENLVTKHKNSFPNAKIARQGIVKNAQIVFCTLSGAGSVAMCEFAHEFDALVIDEAAQAVEASALIPFKFRPSRVILVGDHRQLPATVISKKLLDVGYDRSLFQRFVENGSQVFLLNRQYRMHPDISEFPSQHFYKGKLVQDAKMKDWTARKYHADKLFKPFLFYDVLSGQQSQVSGSKSLRNLTEVEFILLLVRSLLKKYPEMDWRKKIGIIAPYKQQIYELGSHLARLEKDVDKRLDIEVNTVDGFQGREKEIIIYSCVRTSGSGGNRRRGKSNGRSSQGKLDAFWADERRMNVAITRAKSSLWIVGNSQLLEQSRAWRALIRTAKDHDKYILNTDAGL